MSYIDERIENKILSQIDHWEFKVKSNFKNRHKIAGLSKEQGIDLVLSYVRHLRVWREMWHRNSIYNLIKKV